MRVEPTRKAGVKAQPAPVCVRSDPMDTFLAITSKRDTRRYGDTSVTFIYAP